MDYMNKSVLTCPWGVPLPCPKCGIGNVYSSSNTSSNTSSYGKSSRVSQDNYSLGEKNDNSSPVRVYSGGGEGSGKSIDDKFEFEPRVELNLDKKRGIESKTSSFGMNNIYQSILEVNAEEDIENDNRSFEWASRRLP